MLAKLNCKAVKIRRPNSQLFNGEDKFTGTVMFSVVGTLDGGRVRLSLDTGEKNAAFRRIGKLERACAEGPQSPTWAELEAELPKKTFEYFAGKVGYVKPSDGVPLENPTWADLCRVFEAEMERRIQRKLRGEQKLTMKPTTRERYRQTVQHFEAFLGNPKALLSKINEGTIEMYKIERYKAIAQMKQARGGSSVRLDIAVLHGMFNLAVKKKIMQQKPIQMEDETKPGANPQNGARPFTADELSKLRKAATVEPKTELQRKAHKATGGAEFVFLVMLWTGLRGSDLVRLCWKHVLFNRGVNGEIEIETMKRNKIAIIPLSDELRPALEQQYFARKAGPEDAVLLNPDPRNCGPFSGRIQLYNYCLSLGRSAGVERAIPHNYRDSFACDAITKDVNLLTVAKMLADTVQTVEQYYAKFILGMRDNAQHKMSNGIGIEKQGELAEQRGQKVIGFPQ
jgi:integrase